MRSLIFVIGVFVLMSFATADSNIRSNFNIQGCDNNGEGIAPDSCSRDGQSACNSFGILEDTLNVPGACKIGSGSSCCPAGFECSGATGSETCVQRTIDCGVNGEKPTCEANSCFWIEGSPGTCVDKPADYSCGVYKNPTSCSEDIWNLGTTGLGTAICGTFLKGIEDNLVVPSSSCGCEWTDPTGCVVSYDVTEEIYAHDDKAKSFTCRKDYTDALCVEGKQGVSWTASFISRGLGTSQEVLEAAECVGGDETRTCGTPIIQLPGFSLFALISSLAIIGLFYFVRRSEE